MDVAQRHPEDVKAELKKRHRTVAAFERAYNLPEKSVTDLFRGRASARVTAAIEKALTTPVPTSDQSEVSDGSSAQPDTHRLNEGGR